MALSTWVWPKQDDKLTTLDRFIRNVNVAMKKLENALGIQQTTLQAVGTFTNGATTPNISLASVWKTANTAPTSITNFLGGDAGKSFDLIFNDANTTLVNNANVKTKTGANRTPALGNTTRFVSYDSAVWYEVPTP